MTATVIEATETTTTTAKPVKMDGKTRATTRNLNHGTAENLDTLVAALRKRFEAADKGETAARARFEAADIDWQNARVIKVRVAYAAAMLTPNKGAANLLAATRYLLTDPADTPAKRTAAAKSRKNTLRNYVAAGEALQEAGLIAPDKMTEPDANERKIVADVFREMNKRDKADKDAADAADKGETETETGEDTPETGEALTIVDIVAHIARLNKTLDLMAASGIVISEADAANVGDMLAGFASKLNEYAADK
jgi:hypothetical protein